MQEGTRHSSGAVLLHSDNGCYHYRYHDHYHHHCYYKTYFGLLCVLRPPPANGCAHELPLPTAHCPLHPRRLLPP